MSDITVKIGKKEYELVCTTAAYVEICKKYGGVEEMAETFQGERNQRIRQPEVAGTKETSRCGQSGKQAI